MFEDPMFAEFVAAERSSAGECEVPDPMGEALEALSSRPVGPWDRDPGWSPWQEEEEDAARLSEWESWSEELSGEDMSGEGGPGEVPVVPELSEDARERARAFRRWEEDGPRLSSGSSAAVYNDYGDRMDEDGREARGLVRVPGSKGDGRAYWWAIAVWANCLSVESWSEAFEAADVEGLAILHDRDAVSPHIHAVVRRRGGRLKGSSKQIRAAVAAWLGCPREAVSLSPVDDTRAAVAYLTHESVAGGAGKHRYERSEVVEAGGVHLSDWAAERGSDWVAVVSDMQSCIDDMLARGRRVSLQGFISWCHIEAPDWWRVLVVKRAARLFLKDYLNS